MKKLSNLEWSFSNIDNTWKNKTCVLLTKRFRIVINLSKTCLQIQSFFIVWNQKQMVFVLGETGSGKRSCLKSKVLARLFLGYKTYIKLHISSVTVWHLFQFYPVIPTDWRQEKPLGYSAFAEPNYLFTQHIYLPAYLAIILQVSCHIAEGK